MALVYRDAVAGAIRVLWSHPRAGPVLISLVGAGVLGKVVLYIWRNHQVNQKRRGRQEKARARTKQVVDRVAKVTGSDKIVRKSVHELRDALRSGDLTALEVIHAFQKKALAVSEDLNCVTEPLMEAEGWAIALDESVGFKGLLHGIPVSIKENVAVAGYDLTAGMEIGIDLDVSEDAVIVKMLKHHGAVPFVRTNIPQTMLSYDSSNPLYGTTLNPQDKKRTPGGSSSGEGALIGGGGSIMGIGNDIGGSVRIPAEFCGIYALKPTWDRVSRKGMMSLSKGNLVVRPTNGPMARDFDSLLLLSKAFFSPPMYELDPTLPRQPFNIEEYERTAPMRIGFYTFDGNIQCQPANIRAVLEAKSALESMGHEVVHFDFPTLMGETFNGGRLFMNIIAPDRMRKLAEMLANDKVMPSISMYLRLASLPRWLSKAAQFLVGLKDQMAASVIGGTTGLKNIGEYLERIHEVEQFRTKFMQTWQSKDLDAVICPVYPSPAPTRDIVGLLTPAGIYCWLYNALNYPSGVAPVTKITKKDLEKTFDSSQFKPQNMYEKLLLKCAENSEGLSVGVQCVSLPFQEEVCLRVMRDLKQGLAKVSKS